jgi:hypothetical protein
VGGSSEANWDLTSDQNWPDSSDLGWESFGDDPGATSDYPSWGSAQDPLAWSAPFPVNGTVFEVMQSIIILFIFGNIHGNLGIVEQA